MFNNSQYTSGSSQYGHAQYGHESQYGRTSTTPGPQGNTQFTSSTSHNPSGNTWGASGAGGMGESFGQSRGTYQQGYILSTSQSNNAPSTSPRFEELPVVQTKAKMNASLVRAPTIEFGKDPMFESSRRMQALDEDAPPTASVNDILNATYSDSQPTATRTLSRSTGTFEHSLFASSSRPSLPTSASSSSQSDPLYVIVFGYPADKHTVTADYFKQLGTCTSVEPVSELTNAFRVGYTQPADAMRAVRKNGEVLAGQWMVGAKWENQAKAESMLGQSLFASSPSTALATSSASQMDGMAVDEPSGGTVARVRSPVSPGASGSYTPVRLAPAASAFRKPGTMMPTTPKGNAPSSAPVATPGKGVLGQVSDMIFGW